MRLLAPFLDASKAFSRVWHDLLLQKLEVMGFWGPFNDLLKKKIVCLSNRSQVWVIRVVRPCLPEYLGLCFIAAAF